MPALFHRAGLLSIGLAALAAMMPSAQAAPGQTPFWGRWKVADQKAVFSSRGREYKTIDIAPCGKDFCGVSVKDNGQCGATLFRFLMKRAGGEQDLRGHGKWGAGRKNVLIWLYVVEDGSRSGMQLYLGDGYDFGERSSNMPKFESTYQNSGVARCKAK